MNFYSIQINIIDFYSISNIQTINKAMKQYPHSNVYTRLGISKIHGIGVLAIRDIPKGTKVFSEDKSKLVWFTAEELELDTLSPPLRQFYEDFCVLVIKDGSKMYGCIENFTHLTIEWYLNHADNPNVYCDKNYDFYTLTDIRAGEELTSSYDTYSDKKRAFIKR
jgi:SET domain-containing protein